MGHVTETKPPIKNCYRSSLDNFVVADTQKGAEKTTTGPKWNVNTRRKTQNNEKEREKTATLKQKTRQNKKAET